MSKLAATGRLTRLVAAIPWIVAQEGAPVDEIAERFDYPRELLLSDLEEVVFYVGVPPYTPDTMIDVLIEDDIVWISYADWFARPMRLSGPEALTLIAAGETMLAFADQDETGPLVRALTKVRLATGTTADVMDVQLGAVAGPALPVLRSAIEQALQVEIRYHGYASNTTTTRQIEPHHVFASSGASYVSAYCHLADSTRVFRIDRIESAQLLDAEFAQPTPGAADELEYGFSLDSGVDVTIEAPAERAYAFVGVPVHSQTLDGDTLKVALNVTSSRWLEQLLLRLGPTARLATGGHEVDVVNAARRIAMRYQR